MRDGIFFVCESLGGLNLAARMVSQFNFNCPTYVFLPEKLLKSNFDMVLSFDFYTANPQTIPGILQWIKLVILGAHESTPHCRISNAVGYLAKATNTSHVSIQHGWIQPGLNFKTNTPNIDYKGINTDNSQSLFHFSRVIRFFGKDGIGYPSPEIKTAESLSHRNRCIVATNFNWGVYSTEDIATFCDCVAGVRLEYPDAKMVHRPHPAERSQGINDEFVKLCTEIGMEDTSDCPGSEKLDWPDLVVSTPSTIVLDYISTGVHTVVYAPHIFKSHISELQLEIVSFKDLESLRSALKVEMAAVKEKILPFPSDAFAGQISALYGANNEYMLDENIFARYFELLKV